MDEILPITDKEFWQISDLVYNRFGIKLKIQKIMIKK